MDSGPPTIEPEGLLDGLHWDAIFLGAVLDIAATFVILIPVMLVFAGGDAFSGDPEASREAIDTASAGTGFLLASLLGGLAATVYGAYFGARRAGEFHLRHGGWVAVCSAGLGLLLMLLLGDGGAEGPIWLDALSIVLMIPAGLLGGLLARRQANRIPDEDNPWE